MDTSVKSFIEKMYAEGNIAIHHNIPYWTSEEALELIDKHQEFAIPPIVWSKPSRTGEK